MSIKHTPGPWNLHSPDEGDPITGDGTFCITAKSMVIANAQPRDWHETPANARLIAAAPDLLAALREMVEAFSMDNIGVDALARNINAKKLARDAIAKAEGGAK